MYYEDVVKEMMDKEKSPIKNINWGDLKEVEEIQKIANKLNIKKDIKIIVKAIDGPLNSLISKFTRNDAIAEQQKIIEKLCDAAAFFCALTCILNRKLSDKKAD